MKELVETIRKAIRLVDEHEIKTDKINEACALLQNALRLVTETLKPEPIKAITELTQVFCWVVSTGGSIHLFSRGVSIPYTPDMNLVCVAVDRTPIVYVEGIVPLVRRFDVCFKDGSSESYLFETTSEMISIADTIREKMDTTGSGSLITEQTLRKAFADTVNRLWRIGDFDVVLAPSKNGLPFVLTNIDTVQVHIDGDTVIMRKVDHTPLQNSIRVVGSSIQTFTMHWDTPEQMVEVLGKLYTGCVTWESSVSQLSVIAE